jgi:regulator of sigma E protease
MEILVKAAQFFLSLSILIILHELGHFIFARLFNTRVEKFYLFFNPWFSLFKIKKGETTFGLGWLPLGGYVKISGMIDESMDTEQMKQAPQPWEFRSKPAWQRLLIMLGGVLVNFLLALVIYSAVLYAWGEQYLPAQNAKYGISVDSLGYGLGLRDGDKILSLDGHEVDNFMQIIPNIVLDKVSTIQVERNGSQTEIAVPESVYQEILRGKTLFSLRFPFVIDGFSRESAGKEAGLKAGDHIKSLNGEPAEFFHDFRRRIMQMKNQDVVLTVQREGELIEIPVRVPEGGLLGIAPKGDLADFFELEQVDYTFFQAIPAGIRKGINTMSSYLKQLRLLLSPKTKAYESLGGFLTIGSIFPGQWDWQAFWLLTAFLSIILAIMNILPIPALDGGHVMFLLYEILTGRTPSEKFLEYAQIAGLIILFSLVLFANTNDIIRIFFK